MFSAGQNPADTHLAEVLSTAASEIWVSSHVQTEGTLKVFDWVNKLTLIATRIQTCHFLLRVGGSDGKLNLPLSDIYNNEYSVALGPD